MATFKFCFRFQHPTRSTTNNIIKVSLRKIYSTKFNQKDPTSSNKWLERQRRDIFVKQAGIENYRCRSAFKLLQINEKFNILLPGNIVIDCGAAPGSWCQVAVKKVNALETDPSKPKGLVIGIDLQHMAPIEGAFLLSCSDFTSDVTQAKIKTILGDRQADVVLSDMAPAATGMKSHNHEIIVNLCFSVLLFSLHVLKNGGTMLCKIWMGADQKRLETAMNKVFEHVRVVKPEASRDDSSEIFLLGRGFKRNEK
ncbi:rRNA methyltransferase 2, mitochondrial-like [Physella acuta]|uniref:rRNA methyltransferase 2, mitochondrial-like n=1 Tax=Physella acuta TaxID=109671 RepID=UPI0027DD96B6|nr:rRNA methyltransferase 2, mitochondrial-like [Physella acuta]